MYEKICPTKISRKFSRVNFGFTLIELLVVASILIILSGIGIASYNQFNRRKILDKATQELKSNLRLTQGKALAGEKPVGCTGLLGHKLIFTTNQNYKIVAVCGSGEIPIKTDLALDQNVFKIGEPDEIFFKGLASGVENEGTITLSFPDVGQTTITVTATGGIE